jgi:hypothetical protein
MKITYIVIISIVCLSLPLSSAHGDNVLTPPFVHAIVTNPISVFGKTYNLQVDNMTYPLYYGFHYTSATVSKISVVPESNSIQISLQNVTETDTMWVYIPQSILSSDSNQFLLYVDGKNTSYEIATYSHSTILGFTVNANAHEVQIQGTRVIPEFSTSVFSVAVIGFVSILILRFYQPLKM